MKSILYRLHNVPINMMHRFILASLVCACYIKALILYYIILPYLILSYKTYLIFKVDKKDNDR